MSIGEVLAHLRTEFPDTTISKLRFLEAEGLVDPERTASGYRKYSWNDVARLRFVLTDATLRQVSLDARLRRRGVGRAARAVDQERGGARGRRQKKKPRMAHRSSLMESTVPRRGRCAGRRYYELPRRAALRGLNPQTPIDRASAPPRLLDRGDVDLLHCHHRLEHALVHGGIGVAIPWRP